MLRLSSLLVRWPLRLAALRSPARSTRKRNSSADKSVSLSRLRPVRSTCTPQYAVRASSGGIAFDRAGHAARTAAAAAELIADHVDDLDAVVAQNRVRGHIALVPHHHARRH